MDLGINGKRALVLASSQGLGLGIATALCAEGAKVVLSGRSTEKLAEAATRLGAEGGGEAGFVTVDLSAKDAAQTLFDAACETFGGVDILVNNTGGPPPCTIDQPDGGEWQAFFDTMVVRPMQITNLCLPGMKASGWGRILTVTSSGVVQPLNNLGMSNTLRSALVGWNKTLSNEVSGLGITCNILAPGRIHTQRVDQLDAAAAKRLNKSVEEIAAAALSTIPVGRYGRVDEFGAVAAFLLSDRASYVTGSVIRCDGGAVKGI